MESVGGGQAGRVAVEYMAIAMAQDMRILHELGGPVEGELSHVPFFAATYFINCNWIFTCYLENPTGHSEIISMIVKVPFNIS